MAEFSDKVMDFLQEAARQVSGKKKERKTKPEDLAYVGVQDTGMARQTADAIANRDRQIKEALGE